MTAPGDYILHSILIGAGATAVLDLWSAARTRFFGIPSPNYALVGRWIGHFPSGRFAHPGIAKSAEIKGERLIGWSAHYATGILFAAILIALCGLDWTRHPTLAPALIFGLATVAAPFLLMQPGMGQGVAASRTPDPRTARMRSLLTHAVFGAGLYVCAQLLAWIQPS